MNEKKLTIVQFCTPHADTIIALDNEGSLWERVRDQAQYAGVPTARPRYLWRKIQGPLQEFDPEVEEQVERFRAALMAARPKK